jgi:hypothetical protein
MNRKKGSLNSTRKKDSLQKFFESFMNLQTKKVL